MGLLLLGAGHIGLEFQEELVCLSESRGVWCNRGQWKLLSALEILSLGLSRSSLDCCFDHVMVCVDYPGIHQLDILEVVTQGWRGHHIVSSGSKDSVDGSIRVVPLLVPSLLVSEPSSRMEVLEHVFHIICCQKVCYLAGPQVRNWSIKVHI